MRADDGVVKGERFVVAMAAATVLPMVGALVAAGVGLSPTSVVWLGALAVVGVPHVGMTAALYLDPEMGPILRSNPTRYRVAPLVAVLSGVLFAALAPVGWRPWFVIVFGSWQLHHFTKQNLGCFSFASRALRMPGPTAAERRMLTMTTVAAVLALQGRFRPLFYLGAVMLFAVLVESVRLGCGVSPARKVMLALAAVFYAPLFVIPAGSLAFVAYSYAHGAQYMVMMGHLPAGRAMRGPLVALGAAFVAVGLPLMWINLHALSTTLGWGLLYGLVATHFIVDAGVWKVRTPQQREFMQRRFAFL